MTDITITNEERIKALERLGYTPREAQFLCMAALHGGLFLRRQYVQFTEKAVGGSAATLIDKALAKGHARSTTFAAGIHIYHLCARPFYRAIGEENNRNRRRHEPASIKAKLMALDFVLTHREGQYLTTEHEKLGCFERDLGIDRALFPSAQYVVRERRSERFFVEKFPILITADSSSKAPKVSFCFLDEGAAGLAGFETFLRKYQPLLAVLPKCKVVYVAATDVHFAAATRAFERRSAPNEMASSEPSAAPLISELLTHFRTRQLVEAKQWDSFSRADLTHYREELDRFSGPKFEALFHRWTTEGEGAVRAAITPRPSSGTVNQATFSTCLLEENYELFTTAAA